MLDVTVALMPYAELPKKTSWPLQPAVEVSLQTCKKPGYQAWAYEA